MILYNPTVSGSLLVTGSLTTTGTLTAQTLVVQTITSSVDFVTGSSVNGSLSSNTHQFTGSVLMSGSLNVGGALTGTTATFRVSDNRNLAIKYDTNITLSGQNDSGAPENLRIYADTFKIFTSTTTVGLTERLTISNTGNVGIGTTSPNSLLTLKNSATNTRLELDTESAGSSILSYDRTASAYKILYLRGSDIQINPNDVTAMTIKAGGNVGIGASTSPVYKLEVSTAGGSERIRVGTLQNNNNTATFEAITSAGLTTATSGWIRAVYGGGLALGTSTYTKANGDSGNFANLSSESATTGLTISSAGVATFTNNVRSVISSPNCVGDDYVNVFKFVAIIQGGISQKNSAVNLRVAYALTGGYGNEHCTYDLVASCNNGTWTIHTDSQTGRVANNGGNFQVSAYSSGDTLYIRSRKENGGGCGYAQMNGTVNFAGCTFSVA